MSKVKKEVLPQGFETKDLVGISYAALKQMFKAVNGRPVTVKELPKWKVVLGFVNATNSTVKTSMQSSIDNRPLRRNPTALQAFHR